MIRDQYILHTEVCKDTEYLQFINSNEPLLPFRVIKVQNTKSMYALQENEMLGGDICASDFMVSRYKVIYLSWNITFIASLILLLWSIQSILWCYRLSQTK